MKPETVHHVAVSSRRPAHYRSDWNEQTMKTALESVLHCGMNISMAARTYNIPKSTLYDHKVGNVLPGTKSGHPTVLNKEEEEELVSSLIECAEIGFPRTRLDVIAMVEMVVVKKEDRELTNGWWQGFCKRHSFLSYKNPTTLSIARAHASSQATLQKYFQLLGETMIKYGLNNDPPLIFNMDESGFPLDPKPPKGVFVRGEKNPCSVTAGNKSQITVVGCVSASGQCLPPMIVWPRKKMKPELAFGEVPGTVYGLVQRGWMTQQLFKCWFERHFLRYAPAARPLLLLLDGHSSHYCPETLKLAQQEDVIMFALPPNTTHLTQPLDKGAFGPLKMKWHQVVHDFRVSHPGQVVTQYNFCRLFSKAWVEAMTPMNISSGFSTTGIYPFNPNALKLPCQPKTNTESMFVKDGVSFTPAKRKVFVNKEDMAEESFTSPDSPLVSFSDYHSSERQNTFPMMNIQNVPPREFKKKDSKRARDPSGTIINSAESIEKEVKRKRAKDAKTQKQSPADDDDFPKQGNLLLA